MASELSLDCKHRSAEVEGISTENALAAVHHQRAQRAPLQIHPVVTTLSLAALWDPYLLVPRSLQTFKLGRSPTPCLCLHQDIKAWLLISQGACKATMRCPAKLETLEVDKNMNRPAGMQVEQNCPPCCTTETRFTFKLEFSLRVQACCPVYLM